MQITRINLTARIEIDLWSYYYIVRTERTIIYYLDSYYRDVSFNEETIFRHISRA